MTKHITQYEISPKETTVLISVGSSFSYTKECFLQKNKLRVKTDTSSYFPSVMISKIQDDNHHN